MSSCLVDIPSYTRAQFFYALQSFSDPKDPKAIVDPMMRMAMLKITCHDICDLSNTPKYHIKLVIYPIHIPIYRRFSNHYLKNIPIFDLIFHDLSKFHGIYIHNIYTYIIYIYIHNIYIIIILYPYLLMTSNTVALGFPGPGQIKAHGR